MKQILQLFSTPAGLIFIGAFLSAFGALWASHQSTVFEKNLKEKSYEIAELNKKIADTITGGEGYCYFLPMRPGKKSNIADLMLINDGKYPLYDISVKIDDVEKMISLVHAEYENGNLPYDSNTLSNALLSKASDYIQIGNLGPNQAMTLTNGLKVPDVDKKSYNIHITARNGSVFQIVRYRKVNNEWKMAIKISGQGKTLKEFIDKDYPKNAKGEIDW